MRKAVFLDRDGVINKVILKGNRPFSPRGFEEFELIDGVGVFLKEFRARGFLNIIVTNQPDVARGVVDRGSVEKMHRYVQENLEIDDIFVCFHDDADDCQCRKPRPGMLLEAGKKWDIDLRSSFSIGDQWKDIVAGERAGCTTILIDYPYNREVDADFRVNDLSSAAEIVLDNRRKR